MRVLNHNDLYQGVKRKYVSLAYYNRWGLKRTRRWLHSTYSTIFISFRRYMFEGGTNFGYWNGELKPLRSISHTSTVGSFV